MESLQFDNKFDDGNLRTGAIRGNQGDPDAGLTVTGACLDTSSLANRCSLIFVRRL